MALGKSKQEAARKTPPDISDKRNPTQSNENQDPTAPLVWSQPHILPQGEAGKEGNTTCVQLNIRNKLIMLLAPVLHRPGRRVVGKPSFCFIGKQKSFHVMCATETSPRVLASGGEM